mmetsp:Transcript_36587/g.104614  ORF Transcript_36587/g.104614 Transcript_36587/m.104614 type:complete len:694 (-) Transcript_36587:270-2351(-)
MSIAPTCGVRGDEELDESLDELLWGDDSDAAHDRAHGEVLQRRSATLPRGAAARLLRGAGTSALALAGCAAAVGAWPRAQGAPGASGAAAPLPATSLQAKRKCLGSVRVAGYGNGTAHIILAGSNMPGDAVGSAEVLVDGSGVRVSKNGRVYFGARCTEGSVYDPSEYSSMLLLGRTLSFTMDLSGTACGCVAAMYMTPLVTSTAHGNCGSDYYCDANSVCGVKCAEMDMLEANTHAFHTTAHGANDPNGMGRGLGGTSRDISTADYGPGYGHRINTLMPFRVNMEVSSDGTQVATALHQGDRKVVLKVKYNRLQKAFERMAPILSYWYKPLSGDLSWFDGGVCPQKSDPSKCSETITFSDFAVTPATDDSQRPQPPPPSTSPPPPAVFERPATPPPTPAPAPTAAPTTQAPRTAAPTTAAPTTVAPTLVAPTTTPVPPYPLYTRPCFRAGAWYDPVNMAGQVRTVEPSAVMCQERCAAVEGCAHFSFWEDGGCHLQDQSAAVQEVASWATIDGGFLGQLGLKESRAAWAGPRECGPSLAKFSFLDSGHWEASVASVDGEATCDECAQQCLLTHGCRAFSTEADCAEASARGRCATTSGAASKEGWEPASSSSAYVLLDAAACFEPGGRYEPLSMAGQERSVQVSAVRCQELCASVSQCAHFSYYPDGGCYLQDGAASFLREKGTTAGPASCS